MPESVLDAIRQGNWDFEPEECERKKYRSTDALPGSQKKLLILAGRVEQGLPLWHPEDRLCYEDREKKQFEADC